MQGENAHARWEMATWGKKCPCKVRMAMQRWEMAMWGESDHTRWEWPCKVKMPMQGENGHTSWKCPCKVRMAMQGEKWPHKVKMSTQGENDHVRWEMAMQGENAHARWEWRRKGEKWPFSPCMGISNLCGYSHLSWAFSPHMAILTFHGHFHLMWSFSPFMGIFTLHDHFSPCMAILTLCGHFHIVWGESAHTRWEWLHEVKMSVPGGNGHARWQMAMNGDKWLCDVRNGHVSHLVKFFTPWYFVISLCLPIVVVVGICLSVYECYDCLFILWRKTVTFYRNQ